MKLNRIITLGAMAATLALGATSLLAQDNGNAAPGGDQAGQRRNRQGGGNFDPAAMQQRMLDRVQEELGFTNDTEWDAVKPLVQKVMDAPRGRLRRHGADVRRQSQPGRQQRRSGQ